MALIGFTNDPSHILAAGFASWKARYGADIKRYNLGRLNSGKLSIDTLVTNDSYQRESPHGIVLEASARLMNTDKTAMIPTLVKLGAATMNQVITLQNGKTFTGDWGMKWRFVNDSDFDESRYVELSADLKALVDNGSTSYQDMESLLTAPAADGSSNPSDALIALETLPDSVIPAGVIKYETKPTADVTWEEAGPVRKGSVICEAQVQKDGQGRSRLVNIKVTIGVDLMATSTELAMLKNVRNVDHRLTMPDGLILTLDNILGVGWKASMEGDGDDIQFVRVRGSGIIQLSQWAGIWS